MSKLMPESSASSASPASLGWGLAVSEGAESFDLGEYMLNLKLFLMLLICIGCLLGFILLFKDWK